MNTKRIAYAGLVALAMLTQAASGQPGAPRATNAKTLPPPVMTEDTSLNELIAKMNALQAKVNQLSSQLQPMLQRSNVFCQSTIVSANGLGDTDTCTPYRCNQVTGQCRQSCRSVDDCNFPSAVCDQNGRCVAPPR